MHRIGILALTAVLTLTACADQAYDGPTERQLPMLGASVETGWQGVGALTFQYPGYGYQGSFCTGTLIAPQWVLTAAHCLVSHDDFELWPEIVQFYVGTNANPTGNWGGWPQGGDFYQADAFFIYPDYNPNDTAAKEDIGLLHLSEPAAGVETYPYNASVLTGSFVGSDVFYVGYGATEGVNSTGGGLKRSGLVELTYVEETEYYSEYDGTGVCFGDSGGPGFLEVGGQTRIIGVNSRVGGEEGQDPCEGTSAHTRVDHYAAWIADHLDAPPLDCNTQPDICYCEAACGANGACTNDLCKTKDCEAIYTCLGDCGEDSGCAADCYMTGTDTGKEELDILFQCFSEFCEGIEDDTWGECVDDNCEAPIETCLPIGTGPMSCEEIYGCFSQCQPDDTDCSLACYEQGTSIAQSELDAMLACFGDECADIEDNAVWAQCVDTNCAPEVTACFPPSNCDIAGGDCDAGMACYPGTGGTTDCFPSDDVALGQACGSDATDNLQCIDGGLCISGQTASLCMPMCEDNIDCNEGDYCYAPIFQDVDGIGICICIDEDNDSWCQIADCNDLNPDINADALEVCDDGLDNNCDGLIDEDCEGCVDDDDDGSCAPDDCDDTDPLTYPNADEACGDGRDNNCNGTVDENCDVECPDGDGDGVCDDADCDDADASRYPGAAEACGDNADNDCDGLIDEDCEGCVDADSDGYCLGSTDCDDANAQVNPNATEVCGDGIDQDCDGADATCATPGDTDMDGYFETVDCNDMNAAHYPGAPEGCGDGVDADCDGLIDEGCPGSDDPGPGTGGGDGTGSDTTSSGGCAGGQGTGGAALSLLLSLCAICRRRALVA